MARLSPVVAAAALALLFASAAEAQLRFCGPTGRACDRVTVPLDRSGRVPGEVSLHVERKKAKRPAYPPVILLAGGPGQSATSAFPDPASELLEVFASSIEEGLRGRDVVVFDQRGTGRSGVPRCPELQRADILDAGREAARCAETLGERRAFYTTRDSVEDIEAIRRALGVDKIALYGVSYGTKVALAYALAYPGNVDRMALDSVVEADGPSPLLLESYPAVSRILRDICRRQCRSFTRDTGRDVERLGKRLGRSALRGRVYDGRGRGRSARLRGIDLFTLLVAGDFDIFGLRSASPAAIKSALRGDTAPLLRLARRGRLTENLLVDVSDFSLATYAATTCEESDLPWARSTPFEERRAAAAEFVGGLPPSAFRPFDAGTALASDVLALCERWPAAAAAPALAAGPLPDVPVLLLNGEHDMRTPVENARRVAASFPASKLLVAPDTGHSVVGSDATGCADVALRRFLSNRRPPDRCPGVPGLRVRPTRPLPLSLGALEPLHDEPGRRGRTLRALRLTVRDTTDEIFYRLIVILFGGLEGDAGSLDLEQARVGALRGGYAVPNEDGLVLRRVKVVPGMRVTGRLDASGERWLGRLRVSGRAAPDGVLRIVRGGIVTGRLGGRPVFARWSLPLDPPAGFLEAFGLSAGSEVSAPGWLSRWIAGR